MMQLESRMPVPSLWLTDQWGGPYVKDLNPVEIIERSLVEVDTYEPLSSEMYAVDRQGNETLIRVDRTEVKETIPATPDTIS